jgi:hypothetical protein
MYLGPLLHTDGVTVSQMTSPWSCVLGRMGFTFRFGVLAQLVVLRRAVAVPRRPPPPFAIDAVLFPL